VKCVGFSVGMNRQHEHNDFIFRIEVKIKFFLSEPCRHIGDVEVQLHLVLTSTLGGGEWSTSRPDRLKANSHIPCCSLAAPMPFPCCAMPLRV
jgi:hypothetical protein